MWSSGVRRSKPTVKKLFTWALATGRRHREEILRGQTPSSLRWRLADRLVFKKVKQAFGGQVRDYIAGGAPLGVDTAGWFADVGIRIFEGYGLTETSPVLALNNAQNHRIGSVGKPIESVEYRFAPDGELLVRGPFVFAGYWHKPEATREAIEADGWFHTGDIGRVDEDGFLYITDRKKELLKTSGGKMIAPQPIEGKLNNEPAGSQCRGGWRSAQISKRADRAQLSRARGPGAAAGNRLLLARRAGQQSSGESGIPRPGPPRQRGPGEL